MAEAGAAKVRLLAISGSLRASSSNSQLVDALVSLAPAGIEVDVYRGLDALPHFNLDLDGDAPPDAVADLRQRIGACDGLIICSPEYAHGVAGAMKNALDWLVPSVEFPGKPVALINAAPDAHYAQAHMRETLTVMSAQLVDTASIAVPLQGRGLSAQQIVGDADLAAALRAALSALATAGAPLANG
jgi:chromate reductase, NAD(P)H dehydrogenase (quinone)